MGTSLLATEVLERIEQVRLQVLTAANLTPDQLCKSSDEHLLNLQGLLMMGSVWGKWEFAKEWGLGRWRMEASRTYRLELALPNDVDLHSAPAHQIWRELLRLTIAMRLWPGPSGVIFKPSSIKKTIGVLGQIIRKIGSADSAELGLWSRMSRSLAREIAGKTGPGHINVVAHYHKIGALPDGPTVTKRKGKQARRDRTLEPEHSSIPEDSKQWQPFPDGYTAAAGWRAVQMMRVVGPPLISALERAVDVQLQAAVGQSKPLTQSGKRELKKILDRIIRDWTRRVPDDSPLEALPMTLNLKTTGFRQESITWPPKTYFEAWCLLSLLQACHLWLVALSLPGRHGEISEMVENCLRRETSSVPTGSSITWKLDGILGREIEAPLPDVVVATLRQQIRLAKLAKRVNGIIGDHLWVQVGTRGKSRMGNRMHVFDRLLKAFNTSFSLTPLMEGTNLHMHRFRKTLVRIVALALVHAPKILMDILAHRDEQMTVMRYILADPGILSEIEEVTRELVILKGLEAIDKRDQLQGKAAPILRERVVRYASLLGKRALEPQNLREFVEVITEGGGGWAIIGPGKVCTGFRKGGLCNDGTGEANPHYCNPECKNQLLFPDYEQVDGTVASAVVEAIETLDYMIEQLRHSDENGEEMLIPQFAGQIKGLLRQWREVDQHFRNRHLGSVLVQKHIPDVVLLP